MTENGRKMGYGIWEETKGNHNLIWMPYAAALRNVGCGQSSILATFLKKNGYRVLSNEEVGSIVSRTPFGHIREEVFPDWGKVGTREASLYSGLGPCLISGGQSPVYERGICSDSVDFFDLPSFEREGYAVTSLPVETETCVNDQALESEALQAIFGESLGKIVEQAQQEGFDVNFEIDSWTDDFKKQDYSCPLRTPTLYIAEFKASPPFNKRPRRNIRYCALSYYFGGNEQFPIIAEKTSANA